MAKRKTKPDTRGPLQRVVDREEVAAYQGEINVLTEAQLSASVDGGEGYGPELRLYAPEGRGRRYSRLQHLDRLKRNNKLTHEQFAAGDWYRSRYEAGRYDAARTQDWTRVRGENVVDFTLPVNAQHARDQWRMARRCWPTDMIGFMDAFLLRDQYPKRHHRAAARQISDIRRALDAMAKYLRIV